MAAITCFESSNTRQVRRSAELGLPRRVLRIAFPVRHLLSERRGFEYTGIRRVAGQLPDSSQFGNRTLGNSRRTIARSARLSSTKQAVDDDVLSRRHVRSLWLASQLQRSGDLRALQDHLRVTS